MIPICWAPDPRKEHDHEAWVGNYRMQVRQGTTQMKYHLDLIWPDRHMTPIHTGGLDTKYVTELGLEKFAIAAMEHCENALYKALLSAPVESNGKELFAES